MRGTRTAAKSRRSAKGYGILASPADAGERSTSANHTSFYSCSWDVFPYDLFPVQLCPMGLLLGQVSKWRAQRADRGAHAARGFVRGAAGIKAFCRGCCTRVSMPHAALCVVQRTIGGFPHEKEVSMPHAALWVVQPHRSQPLSPWGEKALLESLRKFESSDEKYVKYPFLFSFSLRRNPLLDQHLARP